jgi:hypothetical protein
MPETETNNTPEYITACFTVYDPQAFANMRQLLCDLMLPQGPVPYEVTALSLDNEVMRLELIEQALEKVDDSFALRDVIGEILRMADVGRITKLEDIEQFKDLEL